jgi:hypothetical protein
MSSGSPARKAPNIWAIASVTYGAVILVTILSVVAYYFVARGPRAQTEDNTRAVVVGSVWMPIYPGASIAKTASAPRDNATESTLNFESPEPVERVFSFYQAALKKGVFRFENVQPDAKGGGTVRSVVHQGKTTVVVTIQAAGSGTQGEIRTVDKATAN